MRLTRLYVPDHAFSAGQRLVLVLDQSHYLLRVLRMEAGQGVILFNEISGGWQGELGVEGKKAIVTLREHIQKPQPSSGMHLLLSPLKKEAWDFCIEKATELGAASIRPVLMDYTQNTRVNAERTKANLIEAAQQCERTDVPEFRGTEKLAALLAAWPKGEALYVALERSDAKPALAVFSRHETTASASLLIGPEGGFSPAERELFNSYAFIRPVTLGKLILRAETAAITGLALLAATGTVNNSEDRK